jgi:hypothetical protein
MRGLLWCVTASVGAFALVCGPGCDALTGKKPTPTPTGGSQTGGGDTTVTPGPGGGVVAGGGGGGGSGGAAQAIRKAAQRTVTMHDLNSIRIFIENASLASGQMPSVQETYQALQKEAPHLAKLVDEKVLTLHPARTREEVWAYETAALQSGGQVLTSQGVERMDAATLKRRLGQ